MCSGIGLHLEPPEDPTLACPHAAGIRPHSQSQPAPHSFLLPAHAASINPTYTYGKRHTTSGTNSGRAASDGNEQPDVNSKPVTASPPHAAVYPDRGHKADYLFRPLPDPTPSTEHRSQQRKTE